MLLLSLVWLLIGALIGLLANAAQLRPPTWTHLGWLVMMSIGAIIALCGGWLGVWLLENTSPRQWRSGLRLLAW